MLADHEMLQEAVLHSCGLTRAAAAVMCDGRDFVQCWSVYQAVKPVALGRRCLRSLMDRAIKVNASSPLFPHCCLLVSTGKSEYHRKLRAAIAREEVSLREGNDERSRARDAVVIAP